MADGKETTKTETEEKPDETPKTETKEEKPEEKKEKKPTFNAEQTAEIARQVKEASEAAAEKTKNDIEEKAKTDAAKEAGKYEDLYNEINPKYEDLKIDKANLENKVEGLEKVVREFIESRKKELPDHIKALDPEHEDLTKELEWLNKAAGKVEDTKENPPKEKIGNPKNPPKATTEEEVEQKEKSKKAVKGAGIYGGM